MNISGKSIVLSLTAATLLSSCWGFLGTVAVSGPLPLYSPEEPNVRLGEFSMEWKERDIAFVFAMDCAKDLELSFQYFSFDGTYLVMEEGEEKLQKFHMLGLVPQKEEGTEDHASGETPLFFTGFEFEGEKLSSDPFRVSFKEGRNELLFKTTGENWRLNTSIAYSFTTYIQKKGDNYTLFGGAFALAKEDLPPNNAFFAYAWPSGVNIQGSPSEASTWHSEENSAKKSLPR